MTLETAPLDARVEALEKEVRRLTAIIENGGGNGPAVATDEAALRRCVLASLRGNMKPLERFVAAGGKIPRRA